MSYFKVPRKIDPWTKLTRKEAVEYEKNILIRLNNNFECICKKKKDNHFPTFCKIIKCTPKRERHIGLALELSDCGKTLRRIGIEKRENLKNIDDIEDQIDCIVYNMKKSNIIQLDIGYSGSNLCIKNGILYMIDFGQAVMDNIVINDFFKKTLKNEVFGEYYHTKILKEQLLWIVKNSGEAASDNSRVTSRRGIKWIDKVLKSLKSNEEISPR